MPGSVNSKCAVGRAQFGNNNIGENGPNAGAGNGGRPCPRHADDLQVAALSLSIRPKQRRRRRTQHAQLTTLLPPLDTHPPSSVTTHIHTHTRTLAFSRLFQVAHIRSDTHNTLATMVSRLAALLLSGVAMLHAQAQTAVGAADLVGTWTSKSNSTMTGPVWLPYCDIDGKIEANC